MNKTHEIIIDAHMHLPVEPVTPEGKKTALLEEMKRNGVSKGVVISDSELESPIGSLAECAELFAQCPDIAVVGGISPFIRYEQQLGLMDELLDGGLLVGIKLFCGHEPVFLTDDNLGAVYALAAKHHVPVLFHSGWDNAHFTAPDIIRQAAMAHPEIVFVCCHCCYPHLDECFDTLADCGNVFFDLSSVAEGRCNAFARLLETTIGTMPERFLFGSDFGSCSQTEHLEFFRSLKLSEEQRRMLFCDNARRLYRL